MDRLDREAPFPEVWEWIGSIRKDLIVSAEVLPLRATAAKCPAGDTELSAQGPQEPEALRFLSSEVHEGEQGSRGGSSSQQVHS